MRSKSILVSLIAIAVLASTQSSAHAQNTAKSAPTANSVKALFVANKNGGAALTQALIEALKSNPDLISVVGYAKDANPQLLASISAAISQAIVEIALTDPAAAVQIKKIVETNAPDALKQQIALNLEEATTTTAATGSTGDALGGVGVPLAPTSPSSSVSGN